eukprot:TRINITY_DN5141_c0_g1_i3.p1 TRINITY_DN5141_c0_g1~~TRINITY_DN5141_c0_g1_i3.p1  ORF type:complete len:213 (-),score=45.30 TRINITY_DN5141_c0_g1_i3:214-852(-)
MSRPSRRSSLSSVCVVAGLVLAACEVLLAIERQSLSFILPRLSSLRSRQKGTTVVCYAAKKKAAATSKSSGKGVKDGDLIYIKGRHGNYLNGDSMGDMVHMRANVKAERCQYTIETEGGGPVKAGDKVWLRGFKGGYVDFQQDMVRMRTQSKERCPGVVFTKKGDTSEIKEGEVVFMKGGDNENYMDIENQDVRCRWPDEGDWQRLTLEIAE